MWELAGAVSAAVVETYNIRLMRMAASAAQNQQLIRQMGGGHR